MAAPVIQSKATGVWEGPVSTYTLTKPTGLSVGETLLAVILTAYDGGSSISAATPPGGWSTVASYDATSNTKRLRLFSKIADSSDVAASNFTFTTPSATDDKVVGVLFRITGATSTASLTVAKSTTVYDNTADTTLTGSISLDTTHADTLLLQTWFCHNNISSHTISDYTVSGTNPTWTEQIDVNDNDNISHVFAVASASISTPRTLTSVTATASSSISDAYCLLVTVPPVTNVTATPDSIDIDLTQSAPSPSATVNITPTSIAIPLAQSAPTTNTRNNPWSNTTKPSTTWTNPNKT